MKDWVEIKLSVNATKSNLMYCVSIKLYCVIFVKLIPEILLSIQTNTCLWLIVRNINSIKLLIDRFTCILFH